ncbi:MAG: NAD-dependent succinate-semialdehyde dehydrogenase [Alphaproteobacteria bacterium]|nr:NAD-dependent succinate-semialdehyde dehydrogenase [Alphaproteobacteria bacterium]
MYINGAWVDARKSFASHNPANGEVLGHVPDGNEIDARLAIAAAAKASPEWAASTAYLRSNLLHRAWQIMMERKEELARLMTEEQGKPLKASRNEVVYGADFLQWFSEEAKRVYGAVIPAPRAEQRFITLRQPVGVVAAITPWNYPISMLTRKMAPALAAGCTIVLKPAEATPLCAMAVFKVFHDAGFPPGVVNLVTASDPVPVGQEMTANPLVRKITFTGSTRVGKMIAASAAAQVKRVSMELGGHAPFILCPDADPVHAAKGAVLIKGLNTGQACISPNRFLVHRPLVPAFVTELTARTAKLKAGSGLDESVSVGPLINSMALDKVHRQVEDALSKGAKLECGGHRLTEHGLDKGCFYAPTVLSGVTRDMLIWHEETFGPIAPVIAYDDEAEILPLANDTAYGLAAYVYTPTLARAMRLFEGLHFGIIGINDINPTAVAAPFGGMQESGLGREGGAEGISEYLETKLGGFSLV